MDLRLAKDLLSEWIGWKLTGDRLQIATEVATRARALH
jgi:hypothetical protein